jgi:cation-transporting ATPase E
VATARTFALVKTPLQKQIDVVVRVVMLVVALMSLLILLADEVPFTSERQWSALAFASAERPRVYVLGALEVLKPYLPAAALAADAPLSAHVRTWSDAGLRVLVLSHHPEVTTLHDDQGHPQLPALTPLGVLSFRDELRPDVRETLAPFRPLGIQLKMVSGGAPQTVAALAKQAGFAQEVRLFRGLSWST